MTEVASGTAVVLIDPALGGVIPVAALPKIRRASVLFGHGAAPAPEPAKLLDLARAVPLVLLVSTMDDLAAKALYAAGAEVIGTPRPPGAGLLDAVAVMDRLRSPGGCPWDAEQTHESLARYLREESYELLDAIEDGDRVALREELGDVLLQVLFHARVAAEDTGDPFTIDDVAHALVTKLVRRHPHVFDEDGDPAVRDARTQERRWEELKDEEKGRESSVDGVAMGQPALALAAKLVQRTARVGLPEDLLPKESQLFDLAAAAQLADQDPEGELRTVARRFAADVRAAEQAARAAGVDPSTMDHDAWRRFWPREIA
jgi:NTP pyrophosphatase (non-canonical NTP hydrolase)